MNTRTTETLLQHMKQSGYLRTPAVAAAFRRIDRADFVDPEFIANAYDDIPLPIGSGQTISQPSTVAFMLERLAVKPRQRVLDIGSGSGYTSALLGVLVGKDGRVIGLERVLSLVRFAQKNLSAYPDLPVEIQEAGSTLGLPGEAFDRILVSAAAETFPETLLDQLTAPGRIVIPIQNSVWLYEKDADKTLHREEFPGFTFVPLVE